jgi:hypothetical protein
MLNKKNIVLVLFSALTIVSCTKDQSENIPSSPDTSVSLTNANGSGKTVNFFVNGKQANVNGTVVSFGTAIGPYYGLNISGTNTFSVVDATAPNAELFSGSFNTTSGTAYTFIAYDTLISGKIKGILLNSNRNVATDNNFTCGMRFLNLSPKSPSLELIAVRSFGAVVKDSASFGIQPYLGGISVPDISALSKFINTSASEAAGSVGIGSLTSTFILKLKVPTTGTVISSSAATSLIPARNYTIFARGTYPSSVLSILANN